MFDMRSMVGGWTHFVAVAVVSAPAVANAQGATPGLSAAGWMSLLVAGCLVAGVVCGFQLRRARREAGALRRTLDRAKSVASLAPQQSIIWDIASGGEQSSPGLAALIGPEGSGAVGFRHLSDLFDEADSARLDAATQRLRGDGIPFTLSLRHQSRGTQLRLTGERAEAAGLNILWVGKEKGSAAAAEPEGLAGARILLDALPIPVWTRAPSMAIAYSNEAYAQAVELDTSGRAAEIPELAARVIGNGGRALAERAQETGETQSERHHIVIGGERRFVEIYETPLGETGEVAGFAIDRTEIENVQADLSRHIAGHEGVLQNLGTAIAIYDVDKRLVFYNNAFMQLWQFEESWLGSEPTLNEVLEEQRERRLLPEFADFPQFKSEQLKLFTSLLEPVEDLVHLPNGTALRSVVAPHALGGLLFTWEDVTDALALERSYNTLIAVQRETLDHLYEGVAVIGGDGRLKLSNPAFASIWRLSEDGLASEPHISNLVDNMRALLDDGGDWAAEKEEIIGLLTDRQAQSGRVERTDGSVLDYATVPLPDGAVLLSYQDVTDSNRVERALLERNEALETADRLKSEFIASVSYELRTPLNTIIGFAEILTGKYFGDLNERQAEYSDGILESSHRLLSLINNILDLATIEAGHMSLELDTIGLKEMLNDVIGLMGERVRKKRLKTELICPEDIGIIVADERRLKQALFNILSNAVKFTPDSGKIKIAAEREADGVRLICTDTGIGIDADDRGRVFGKFERGSNPEARRSGAGLGLSLVKSFIELHGGNVDLESEPGVGTTVKCWLPSRGMEDVIAMSDDTPPDRAAEA